MSTLSDKENALRDRLAAHGINLDDYSPLLRAAIICNDPKRNIRGILPMTRPAFLANVEAGYIAPPVRLGPKMVAWRRADILKVLIDGMQTRRGAVAARRAAAASTAAPA